MTTRDVAAQELSAQELSAQEPSAGDAGEVWDAGDMGCGELVMLLRLRLKTMPGRVLRVVALDSGAPEDLPAWCRMTRNELLRHDPQTHSFWIRSRSDWP